MKSIIYICCLMSLSLFVACSEPSAIQAETGHDDHGHSSNPDEVHLLQKQMDVMDIRLGKFQFLNLSTTVKSNGQLQLPAQNKASVSALMAGRVKSIAVVEGDYVNKGQELAQLEHPDFIEIQEQYLSLNSQMALSRQNLERQKSLNADSVASLKSLQVAESEFQSLNAKVGGLRMKLQMMGIDVDQLTGSNYALAIVVRSPINGYIRSIDINMGLSVLPNQSMFEIVDNDHIHIDLSVYEKDMSKIQKGQKVVFALSSNPDSVFQGKVFALGRAFEQEPKAMVVHAEIDNHDGSLLSGMYVDARIVTNEDMVRALPNDAIVSDGGLNYIFVLKPSSTDDHEDEYVFRKIEVNTGATDIGFTEVVPVYNLPEHVQMVTSGAFYLLAEMKKGEGGHGHHH
jgi:membrane fusion protein, heavy metal efflux system